MKCSMSRGPLRTHSADLGAPVAGVATVPSVFRVHDPPTGRARLESTLIPSPTRRSIHALVALGMYPVRPGTVYTAVGTTLL